MLQSTVEFGGVVSGLQSWIIENSQLRLTILPEAGGKIWQILHKRSGTDLLWNREGLAPARHASFASYDDCWAGGWDELFPNDEAGEHEGRDLPDHGELWTGDWNVEPFEEDQSAGLRLTYKTPITNFLVKKVISLAPNSEHFRVAYRLTNCSDSSFPFLFKLHPAFAVTSSHRLDFPAMNVELEGEFAGSLADAPKHFSWPYAPLPRGMMDLRQIPDPTSGATHFFYGTGFEQGWCALTNRATGLAAGLRFDPKVFCSCWLFATHGGWNGLNVAVPEPATGYPFRLTDMIRLGKARWLGPGETLETEVLFATGTGLASVGGIDSDGMIHPGE